MLVGGVVARDTFNAFVPTLGMTYSLGTIDVSYSGSYNTVIGGIGDHIVGINFALGGNH